MISLPSSSVANGTMVSDLLAELELGRVVLGEPALDADHVVELHKADAERDEVPTRRSLVRQPRGKALRRPRDEGAAPRQQHVRHFARTALRAALLDAKGGRSAVTAGAVDELGVLVGPGRDLRGDRDLQWRRAVDDNRKWRSRLERTRPGVHARDRGGCDSPSSVVLSRSPRPMR